MLNIPHQVVIAGLNIHSLVTALLLRQAYKKDVTKITIMGNGQQTQNVAPAIVDKQLNALLISLGETEESWMQKTAANFKLRNTYIGWSQSPFSLAAHSEVDIYHHPLLLEVSKLRRQQFDIPMAIDEFFFASMLAQQNLSPKGKDFPFRVNYEYQVDGEKLQSLLMSYLALQDIELDNEEIEIIELGKNNHLKYLETSSHRYEADYFFDCTGFQQTLLSNLPLHSMTHIQHLRIHDRVLTARIETDTMFSETRCIGYEAGFIKQISLDGEMIFQYHYSSKFIPDKTAVEAIKYFVQINGFSGNIKLDQVASAEHLAKQPWIGNCIALGKAAGFSRSAEDHEILHTFFAVDTFLKSVRSDHSSDDIISQFNLSIKQRFNYCLAYADTLLLMNTRRDKPYWQLPQDPKLFPALVAPIFQKWLSTEDLEVDPINDNIGLFGWYSLFAGTEQFPQENLTPHPEIDAINENLNAMRKKLKGCSLNFPSLQTSKIERSNYAE